MENKRIKRYYSQENKIEIVKRCLSGESSKEAERRTGIGARLIRNWIKEYNEFGENGLKNKRRPGNPLAKYINKKNFSEIEQLRYELAKAEIEIAKLKKVYELERPAIKSQ
jgi:Transposase and inactivated derivatives